MIGVVWFGNSPAVPIVLPVLATLATLWITGQREKERRKEEAARHNAEVHRLESRRFMDERRVLYAEMLDATSTAELTFDEVMVDLSTDAADGKEIDRLTRAIQRVREAREAIELLGPLEVRIAAIDVAIAYRKWLQEIVLYRSACLEQQYPRPVPESDQHAREGRDRFRDAARVDLGVDGPVLSQSSEGRESTNNVEN